MIYSNILDTIGNTPVVRINRIGRETGVEIYAKCEFLSAGGSVKDRIAVRMIEEMERRGELSPGCTLIEPSSGNTGTGLALVAAVKGYHAIITMPEKMSREKQVVMEALGAEIVRTPTDAPHDAPESLIGVAKRLHEEIEGSHIPDQYGNPDNPLAHYYGTGKEIWDDFGDSLDVAVLSAGTGGTIAGVARYLKEKNPGIRIIGVDPEGSVLGGRKEVGTYQVEGIGYDFVPDVLTYDHIDEWIYTNDRDSLLMARRLIREEGLLVGGSSGSAMCGVLEAIRRHPGAKRVLTILPDSIRNYMSKFVNDAWMKEHGFLPNEASVGGGSTD